MDNAKIELRLNEILTEHNPCKIQVIAGRATCRDGTPCCGGCSHLTANGCGVNSVACKFYFCPAAWTSLPNSIQEELRELGKQWTGPMRQRFSGGDLMCHGVWENSGGDKFHAPWVW
jgi:hypothetical protein